MPKRRHRRKAATPRTRVHPPEHYMRTLTDPAARRPNRTTLSGASRDREATTITSLLSLKLEGQGMSKTPAVLETRSWRRITDVEEAKPGRLDTTA